MAYSAAIHEDSSDKRCVESCNLKYGLSEAFNKTVVEQQLVTAAKVKIIPQIFQ